MSLEEFMINTPKTLHYKKAKETMGFKKTYIISNNKGKRPILKINKVNLPFGVESFNGKSILNVEIIPESSNEHYNTYSAILGLEKQFSKYDNFEYEPLKEDIDEKGYYQNIKESKIGNMIRTHIFAPPSVFCSMGKMTLADVNNVKANVEIELGSIWINQNNYGILWYVKSIEVLYSL